MSQVIHKPAWLRSFTDIGSISWGIVLFTALVLTAVGFVLHEATIQKGDAAFHEAREINSSVVLSDEVRLRSLLASLDKVILVVRKDFADNPRLTYRQLMERLSELKLETNLNPHVFILNTIGEIVLLSTPGVDPSLVKAKFADREYFQFQKANASDLLHVAAPSQSRITGLWTVPLTRRITKRDGSFGGVVGIAVDPSLFTEPFQMGSHSEQDSRGIIGLDGFTRVRLNGGKIEFLSDVHKSQVFNEIKKAKAGSYIAVAAIDGIKRVVSYRVIDPYGIIIVAATSVTAIEGLYAGEVRSYRITASLFGALTLLMSGLALFAIQRQRKLTQSQQSFNQLIESVPQSIIRMNTQGNILWANNRTIEYAGPSAEELAQGFDWVASAVHPEDRGRLQDFVSLALQNQDNGQSCEYRKRRFDGAYLWYSSQVTRLAQVGEVEDFFLFTSTDIHDRKMAEERARVAQKLESIGQLTGGMAHDFNNLLAINIGNLELVKLEPQSTFAARKLDDAINAAQRGVGLVKSLLALASKQPLLPVQVDLLELVERIAPLLRHALGPRIDFNFAPPLNSIFVKVDEAGLEAVLLNLIVNARDAMPKGGSVRLSLQERNGMALLKVTDTGTGMSETVLKRATEPFFTTKEQGHGTGLGLSTCVGFVKQSGGTMKISSTQVVGTTIEIVLPISELAVTNNVASLNASVAISRKISDSKLSILIVDDEPALADLVLSWARVAGHKAVVLHSADDALTLLAAKTFDVLLTDIVMPGTIDGISLAERANALDPEMKVLLMSGYSRETATNRADMPWPLLVKPFSKQDFEDALAEEFADGN